MIENAKIFKQEKFFLFSATVSPYKPCYTHPFSAIFPSNNPFYVSNTNETLECSFATQCVSKQDVILFCSYSVDGPKVFLSHLFQKVPIFGNFGWKDYSQKQNSHWIFKTKQMSKINAK